MRVGSVASSAVEVIPPASLPWPEILFPAAALAALILILSPLLPPARTPQTHPPVAPRGNDPHVRDPPKVLRILFRVLHIPVGFEVGLRDSLCFLRGAMSSRAPAFLSRRREDLSSPTELAESPALLLSVVTPFFWVSLEGSFYVPYSWRFLLRGVAARPLEFPNGPLRWVSVGPRLQAPFPSGPMRNLSGLRLSAPLPVDFSPGNSCADIPLVCPPHFPLLSVRSSDCPPPWRHASRNAHSAEWHYDLNWSY